MRKQKVKLYGGGVTSIAIVAQGLQASPTMAPIHLSFFSFPSVFVGSFLSWFPFMGKRIGNSSLSFQFSCNFHCSFILFIPSSLRCEDQVRELLKLSSIYFVA
jgi:hypothetical protein